MTLDNDDLLVVCTNCGELWSYDVGRCTACDEIHCSAYKPWMHGCNSAWCSHRDDCPWDMGPQVTPFQPLHKEVP